MKVNIQFWRVRAGNPSLGKQDSEVQALRKMGYSGTLNDMRRAFYRDITGIDDLTTAKARAKAVPDLVGKINFVGKTLNDGNNTKIARFGASNVLLAPSAFTSEFGGGYARIATDDGANLTDSTIAYYDINTPAGFRPQLCLNLALNQYGNRATMLKTLKSLRVRVKTHECTVYVWNAAVSTWENATVIGSTWNYADIDVTNKLNEVIDNNNFVRILVVSNGVCNGVQSIRAKADYAEVVPTFFKSI